MAAGRYTGPVSPLGSASPQSFSDLYNLPVVAVVLMVSTEFTGLPVVLPIGSSNIRLRYDLLFVHQNGFIRGIQQGEDLVAVVTVGQGSSVVVATIPPFPILWLISSIGTVVFPLMARRI